MKKGLTIEVEDHGEVKPVTAFDVTNTHAHKLKISGNTILSIKDTINGACHFYELEIEVKR